jgi:hypothetical protein
VTSVEHLFDEYAVRFRRGERPDLREYLARAGDDADALAALVDRFLQAAPAPAADDAAVARMQAWIEAESPLHRARLARGQRRVEVVRALVKLLGLDPKKEGKVARYYHQLESGLLTMKGIDRRVWEALEEILGAPAEKFLSWQPPPAAPAAAPAYFRAERVYSAELDLPPASREEPDEVDRLFGIGRTA